MIELITWAFSPQNLVLTILLLSIVLYWITVILGVLDVELFNIEPPDPGYDLDAEVDMEADLDSGVTWDVLHWFYVGEIPIMVLISILILSLWTLSMLGNYYLNPGRSWGRALALLGPNIGLSLLLVKLVGLPLRPFYGLFMKDANAPRQVVGRLCRVITSEVTETAMGQARMQTKGAPLILNVRAKHGDVFKKHDEAVVVGRDKTNGVYFIVSPHLER